jgi:hypothetical protein
MKLSVAISTYKRPDGKTPFFLNRIKDSLLSQTHQDFKVYLIGDRYDDNDEFEKICEELNKNLDLYYINLPVAVERDNYKDKMALWSYGGVNAINIGIEQSLIDGIDYVCHLDHDDWWGADHLYLINECIENTNSDIIFTKSTFRKMFLPIINGDDKYVDMLPKSCGIINSSTCINFKKIPLRYRDVFGETGEVGLPSDADLWVRINQYSLINEIKSTFIIRLTCYHEEEGFILNNLKI